MNNEKLKQIRESITNTVSCIDSDNGDYFANAILIDHLKALTDMEAVLLGAIYIEAQCDPVFVSGEHVVQDIGETGGES